jgi:thioglycine synthase
LQNSDSTWRLGRQKKYDTDSTRVKSIDDTVDVMLPVCKEIGVTRISDITFMDRLFIPNYSTTLPGTNDLFWVYSGKGVTNSHAKASALMESIERYSSLSSANPQSVIQGSYSVLSKSYSKILHPAEILEPVNPNYNEDLLTDFVPGFDLLSNERILVPAEIAFYRHTSKYPSVSVLAGSHTNGLAAGNVLEEAVCHALCEVIERDAVSIADLCSSCIPYSILEQIGRSLGADDYIDPSSRCFIGEKFIDDAAVYSDVNIHELARECEPVKFLLRKFTDAGIPLLIKNITLKDISIPTFAASSIEWLTHDYGLFAKGYGTHPDSRVALVRAITEVSQTRASNIQGARDDLNRIRYNENDEIYKRKWQFMPSSLSRRDRNKNVVDFSEIRTFLNKDILDDIKIILSFLKNAGLKKAIIVNLTNPDIGIPVVRAIVPGLETFEVTQSLMGRRAKENLRRTLSP